MSDVKYLYGFISDFWAFCRENYGNKDWDTVVKKAETLCEKYPDKHLIKIVCEGVDYLADI